MLECTEQNLFEEIQAAEKVRNLHRDCADSLGRSYVGKAFRTDWSNGAASPSNHWFEYISLMLGRLVNDNPAAALTARRAGYEQLVTALEDAVTQWIATENPQEVFEPVVTDSFFFMGVVRVSEEDDPDSDRRIPKITQINYWRYFRDHLSCDGIPARYEGHTWYADKDDLLDDPDYNHEAIERIAVDMELEKINKAYKANSREGPTRNQIVGHEIWVPDAPIPDDCDPEQYHGMIYTLGVAPSPKGLPPKKAFIRKPRPFYGDKDGPYVLFGGWPVPGSPYRLAPLAATKEQADELNAHEIAISEAALTMKTVHIVNSTNKKVGNIVKDARTGSVHAVEGFIPGMLETIDIKGPSQFQIEYRAFLQDRLDRVSGIDDATRGNLDPKVTATATNRAAEGDSIRTGSMVRFATQSVKKALEKVVWYMFHSEFFTHQLSAKAAQSTGATIYSGGSLDHAHSKGLRFKDLAIEVEPYSMERTDPTTMMNKLMGLVPMMTNIAQSQAAMPYADFQPLVESLARFTNMRWLKGFIDPQKLQQFWEAQSQAAQHDKHSDRQPPTLPYQFAPADVKAQIEQVWGFQPSQLWQMQPLLDPAQPSQSKNPAFLPPAERAAQAQAGSLHQTMMGRAGAPGARNASRGKAPTSNTGMGAPALARGAA